MEVYSITTYYLIDLGSTKKAIKNASKKINNKKINYIF